MSPESMYMDVHDCPSPSGVHYLEGWGKLGSLLARRAKKGKEAGDQGWPRATPAASKRGVQLHLVDSQPRPSFTKFLWPPHGENAPQELELMALPSQSPLGNRARGCSLVPGLGMPQHFGMLRQH